MDMFKSLMHNPISNIIAAGCGLTGNVHFEGPSSKPLLSALQLLDVSANRLDAVLTSLANLRLDVSRNEIPLRVSPDFIKAVAKSGKELWMADTELANQEEIMANCSNELQLEQMWTARDSGGYSCHDLARRNLQVTPELFLPDVMCGCSPGHFGSGTNCSACLEDTFNDQMNQSECRACPEGGKAPAGSQSLSGCKCPYGAPGTFENKTVCLCDSGEALSSDHECRSCGKLHLVCKAPGSLVATAPLEPGYIRLQEPSEEIFECLDLQHCRNSSCTPGLVWDGLCFEIQRTQHGRGPGRNNLIYKLCLSHGSFLCCFCRSKDGLAHCALHVHKTTVPARRSASNASPFCRRRLFHAK